VAEKQQVPEPKSLKVVAVGTAVPGGFHIAVDAGRHCLDPNATGFAAAAAGDGDGTVALHTEVEFAGERTEAAGGIRRRIQHRT
jgi:hypothetical protein